MSVSLGVIDDIKEENVRLEKEVATWTHSIAQIKESEDKCMGKWWSFSKMIQIGHLAFGVFSSDDK